MQNNNNKCACSTVCCLGWLLLLLSMPTRSALALDSDLHQARSVEPRTEPELHHRNGAALLPQSGYTPVWSNPLSVHQLLEAILGSDRDGLNPEDYNLATLQLLLERNQETGWSNHERTAQLDLLLSDSLVRLGNHLAHGKVAAPLSGDPQAPSPETRNTQLVLQAAQYISSGRVDEWLHAMTPQSAEYTRLKQALSRYRHFRQRGGWQSIADGPALETGMVDARVPELRARLMATGDLGVQDRYFGTYDDAVALAVKHFQHRHGLAEDGVVGSETLAALNVPVDTRIAQILANMERARHAPDAEPDTRIVVDLAGFTVSYIRDGKPAWQGRAVVGRPLRESPVLHSRITWLDLNPSWTVPPTILDKDVLPELHRDPGYLQEKHMQVVDYQGNPVDSTRIEWIRYSGRNFPWLIRQQPGPENALGRIKFMFPNPYAVYMHDTPGKRLFDKPERAFSSGCIRIEEPLQLAALLLENTPGWDRARLDDALASHVTHSVSLQQPVEIFLVYRTVTVGADGTVFFRPDIYRRDAVIIRALQQYRPGPVPAWRQAALETPALP